MAPFKSTTPNDIGVIRLICGEDYYILRLTVIKTLCKDGMVDLSFSCHMRDCMHDNEKCDCIEVAMALDKGEESVN